MGFGEFFQGQDLVLGSTLTFIVKGTIHFIEGEHHTANIETNHYDLVLASNFCRFESPKGNQELFSKAYCALKPDGIFVVNDFVPNKNARSRPSRCAFPSTR